MKNPEHVAALLAELKAECEFHFELDAVTTLAQTVSKPPQVKILDDNRQEFLGHIYHKDTHGYYRCGSRLLHRELFKVFCGDIPRGYVIHHVNEDKADNRLENLQMMTYSEHNALHAETLARVKTFTCAWCGKTFNAPNVGTNRYCSAKCAKTSAKSVYTETKTCVHCGKEFNAPRKKNPPQKFCSRSCAFAYRSQNCVHAPRHKKISRICAVCGEEFTTRKDKPAKCCSPKCTRALQLVGYTPTQKTEERICSICGKKFTCNKSKPTQTCSGSCARKIAWQKRHSNNVEK